MLEAFYSSFDLQTGVFKQFKEHSARHVAMYLRATVDVNIIGATIFNCGHEHPLDVNALAAGSLLPFCPSARSVLEAFCFQMPTFLCFLEEGHCAIFLVGQCATGHRHMTVHCCERLQPSSWCALVFGSILGHVSMEAVFVMLPARSSYYTVCIVLTFAQQGTSCLICKFTTSPFTF